MNKELPIARIRPHLLALNLFQVPIGKGCTSVVNQAGVKGVVACCGDKLGWTARESDLEGGRGLGGGIQTKSECRCRLNILILTLLLSRQ